ncbi:hypothetical protein BB559_006566, partial [Furculomyces boomerangus]
MTSPKSIIILNHDKEILFLSNHIRNTRPPGSKRHKARALGSTHAATVGATIEIIQTQSNKYKNNSIILGNNSE